MKKYYLESLGCPKNLIDSEVFKFLTEKAGYEATTTPAEAHLIIVNTCGFINDAKEESINTILTMAAYKSEGVCEILIATGCLVKRYMDELVAQIKEVDFYVNLKDFKRFAEILGVTNWNYDRILLTPNHYAYLRIGDGCNNWCTYCAIPIIRGRLTSIPLAEVVAEAKMLASRGIKELIITAQDTTQYGVDLYGKSKLIELLREVSKIDGIQWIRLLYLHPAHLSHELIDNLAIIPKILPYFDVPLQHINNEILLRMNRRKGRDYVEGMLKYLREKIPNVMLRTTFIVGFPGETRKEYEELKRFIKENEFARMGIFIYSPEEDTKAAEFTDQVVKRTAINRYNKLMEIQQEVSTRVMERFYEKEVECIIDKLADDEGIDFEGRSWFDAPDVDGVVYIKDPQGKAKVGDIVRVKITDTWEYDLIGEII